MVGAVKVISGTAHPELARGICTWLGTDLCPTTVVRFSNENMLVQVDENVREADVFVIQPSCPPVSDGIIELLMTIDALKHASAGRITAVLPYFPYTPPILCDYLRESRDLANYVLVAGDVGESKDLGHYAARLDLPIAIVDKRRSGDDEAARAVNLIGDVKGKVALIVDDEVASGGTLVEAVRFVLDHGAVAVEACVVHAVLSGKAIERIEASPLRQLVVTDTIPLPARKRIDKIHVQSVARLFADAIRAIHDGSSVSRLFR